MDLPFSESPDEAKERRRFGWLLWLILMMLAALILAGCASKPMCPEGTAFIGRAEGIGMFYGFTAESLAQWSEAVRMEARGECIWKVKGEPT